jgi:hypothetical protein
VLRGEADGHSLATAEFTVTRDASVELTLNPLPAALPEASARTASTKDRPVVRGVQKRPRLEESPPTSETTPTAPPAKAPPNCDAPFFVDKDGIKRVRPECL